MKSPHSWAGAEQYFDRRRGVTWDAVPKQSWLFGLNATAPHFKNLFRSDSTLEKKQQIWKLKCVSVSNITKYAVHGDLINGMNTDAYDLDEN